MTISGKRQAYQNGNKNEERHFHRVESRFGRFNRSLPLPDITDTHKIGATYENRVLAISIPKLKEKAGRKIKIK